MAHILAPWTLRSNPFHQYSTNDVADCCSCITKYSAALRNLRCQLTEGNSPFRWKKFTSPRPYSIAGSYCLLTLHAYMMRISYIHTYTDTSSMIPRTPLIDITYPHIHPSSIISPHVTSRFPFRSRGTKEDEQRATRDLHHAIAHLTKL